MSKEKFKTVAELNEEIVGLAAAILCLLRNFESKDYLPKGESFETLDAYIKSIPEYLHGSTFEKTITHFRDNLPHS